MRLPAALIRWFRSAWYGRVLARSNAVIAVSHYVRGELERSGRIHTQELVTLPNMVDLPSVEKALNGTWPLDDLRGEEPFLLFVGKWDYNKGVHLLPEAIQQAGIHLPVILVGDGPLRSTVAAEAERRGLDFRFREWIDNDAAVLLMKHATLLLFPSAWQEPLSRVLLEGLAAGAAIVALDTGGTRDAIVDLESGWLAHDMRGFAEGIRRVATDADLNTRLRVGARSRAEYVFAAPIVASRVETLYRRLLA